MSPDGPTKPLPEEKLLHLIRGKAARAPSGASAAASSPMAVSAPASAPPHGAGILWQKLQWQKIVVGLLAAMLVVQAVALVAVAMHPLPNVTIPTPPTPPMDNAMNTTSPLQELPSLSASASPVLFAAPVLAPAPTAPKAREGPSAPAKLLTARLTLMGIVAGEPPQAIIEDTQTKRTYFVTTGQAVVEGAILQKVLDNRVVLDLNGETIELTL